mmetsp:Transcript_99582/g.281801  ORF Transcript_99582/g.281801 Transcript_99582/m.281801 type:complete len:222 (+) Transcript_99582:113-778(+)
MPAAACRRGEGAVFRACRGGPLERRGTGGRRARALALFTVLLVLLHKLQVLLKDEACPLACLRSRCCFPCCPRRRRRLLLRPRRLLLALAEVDGLGVQLAVVPWCRCPIVRRHRRHLRAGGDLLRGMPVHLVVIDNLLLRHARVEGADHRPLLVVGRRHAAGEAAWSVAHGSPSSARAPVSAPSSSGKEGVDNPAAALARDPPPEPRAVRLAVPWGGARAG